MSTEPVGPHWVRAALQVNAAIAACGVTPNCNNGTVDNSVKGGQ
ncbi:hypothetical protein [Cellulomonas fimi]|nr:hypothetical protein [Cellulomonas fimi]